MRLGIISDLHIDTNRKKLKHGDTFVSLLDKMIRENDIEVLLLAGDISSNPKESHDFLDQLSNISEAEILFVPGNHDLWDAHHKIPKTLEIYTSFCKRKEAVMGQPRILNEKWAIVGSPGWYDYGFADRNIYSDKELAKGKFRFATWQDKRFVDWKISDQAMSRKFLNQLEEDIKQVSGYNIIMMTHVATHPDFVVPLPHRLYDYMNAYLGASSYASLFECDDIKINIMGHVHRRQRIVDKGIHHIMACLGQYNQWLNPDDPEAEVQNTLKIFTL